MTENILEHTRNSIYYDVKPGEENTQNFSLVIIWWSIHEAQTSQTLCHLSVAVAAVTFETMTHMDPVNIHFQSVFLLCINLFPVLCSVPAGGREAEEPDSSPADQTLHWTSTPSRPLLSDRAQLQTQIHTEEGKNSSASSLISDVV